MRSYRRALRKLRKLFAVSLLSFCLMSAVILVIPLTNNVGNNYSKLLGALFWGFLMCGVLTSVASAQIVRDRLALEKRYKYWLRRPPGVICFASCREGLIADAFLGLCILATVVTAFLEHTYYFVFFLRALSIATVCAHCVFNGRTYEYIRRSKRREEQNYEKSRDQFC